MDGRLAQLAALVAHGNSWLAGDRLEPTRVADGSTFQYVREISFEFTSGWLSKRTQRQDDPEAWLRACAGRGATSFALDPRVAQTGPLPARIAAAFANSTGSSIVVMGRSRERWLAGWTVEGQPNAADSRIWNVSYVGREERGGPVRTPDIEAAHANLEAQVRSARDLASRFGWTDWADWFSEAIAASSANPPVARFHDDALPASADVDRRRLFALAAGSSVFGGMGSWNDLAPPDKASEADYERVSAKLYDAVLDAVAAAVNPRQRTA